MKQLKTIAFLLLITIVSCKKDDKKEDTSISTPSKTQLLTNKIWKLTAITINGANAFDPNDCKSDNTWYFSTGFNFTLSEGSVDCDSSIPNQLYSYWKFENSEGAILLYSPNVVGGNTGNYIGSYMGSYIILQLDENTLKIQNTNGDIYTYAKQ